MNKYITACWVLLLIAGAIFAAHQIIIFQLNALSRNINFGDFVNPIRINRALVFVDADGFRLYKISRILFVIGITCALIGGFIFVFKINKITVNKTN